VDSPQLYNVKITKIDDNTGAPISATSENKRVATFQLFKCPSTAQNSSDTSCTSTEYQTGAAGVVEFKDSQSTSSISSRKSHRQRVTKLKTHFTASRLVAVLMITAQQEYYEMEQVWQLEM
jgi:hypothetical protein